MQALKKMTIGYLLRLTIILVVAIFLVVFTLQILNAQTQAKETSQVIFEQVEKILEDNQAEIDEVEAEYSETCMRNAEAVDHMLLENPDALDDVDELKKIAELVEVDEIHIFDETGCIVSGTHPEYYGYTFDSGEQMEFFKPMLEDKTLSLVQNITPNTAEEKVMLYSAVWSTSGNYIVQIGISPDSVLSLTEHNEISYIFSLLTTDVGAELYAIDKESKTIIGSTDSDCIDVKMKVLGFDLDKIESSGEGFHAVINGVPSYCIFTEVDGTLVGRVISDTRMYRSIPNAVIVLIGGLIIIALVLIFAISRHINKYVIKEINYVNDKLQKIADGNLNEEINSNSSIEFSELCDHIHFMINSLLKNTEKISYVLNQTNLSIGVYEYNTKMKKVRYTDHVPDILSLDTKELREVFNDYKLFQKYIDKLRSNATDERVYCLEGKTNKYIKLEEIVDENGGVLGVVLDVTQETRKRIQVESERDIDALTGLYNRRGLESRLSEMLAYPQIMKHSAVVMVDADGLKKINDEYGHDNGDIYLRKIARDLSSAEGQSIVSRQGGDEFVLILYGFDSDEELMSSISDLRSRQDNSTAQLDEDITVKVSYSLGYCKFDGTLGYQDMLKVADDRMYENKRSRKEERR